MIRSSFVGILYSLLVMVLRADGQSENASVIWHKRVARVIDIASNESNKKHHHKDGISDKTLLELLVAQARVGKLNVYSNSDNNFNNQITIPEITKIFGVEVDTLTEAYPKTEAGYFEKRNFDFSSIHKYRLLEEWTFDPHTGRTEIQITGIAPIREIYDEGGAFRGVQAMFWVKYNDARSIIARYEQYNPGNTIAGHIWRDYFSNDSTTGEVWKKKATRLVDFAQKDDNISHHLTDASEDTSIYKVISAAIKSGKLNAYPCDNNSLTTKLSYNSLQKIITFMDTFTVVDPVANVETLEIRHENIEINKYKILEEWSFDMNSGKTHIQIKGIGPLMEIFCGNCYRIGNKPLFWLRYNDIHNIIAKYEQYNPDNTLAGHIWHDYFLGDVKPEVQK